MIAHLAEPNELFIRKTHDCYDLTEADFARGKIDAPWTRPTDAARQALRDAIAALEGAERAAVAPHPRPPPRVAARTGPSDGRPLIGSEALRASEQPEQVSAAVGHANDLDRAADDPIEDDVLADDELTHRGGYVLAWRTHPRMRRQRPEALVE